MVQPSGVLSLSKGGVLSPALSKVEGFVEGQARIGGESLLQTKAQLLGEEELVVAGGDGVTLRQTGDGAIEAIAGQDDVISLRQYVLEQSIFIQGVRLVHGQGQVMIAVSASVLTCFRQGLGQIIVPMLGGDRRAIRHVGIDPTRSLMPGVGRGVDADKSQGIEDRGDDYYARDKVQNGE